MWFYNESLLSSFGTRHPCHVRLLSYTRMKESHDHVATPFLHLQIWNLFKLPLRHMKSVHLHGSSKDHATEDY